MPAASFAGRAPANPLNLIRLVPAEGAWVRHAIFAAPLVGVFGALAIAVAPLAFSNPAEQNPPAELEEIVVTATLRAVPDAELPGSVSVLDSATLRAAGQQNFEDVLALVPNLNWAGDTSLPRYFQIRGIGELQQYQGAPNPSVGFLIDDIDFSGLGMAATLFDVDHIEVLHGPQGTIYGANALAGLIYVRSAEPGDTFGARVELDAGDYDERSYGAVVTGPVSALDSAFRLAAQQYTSDGFYHNAYLKSRHQQSRRAHGARQVALRAERRLARRPRRAARADRQRLRLPGRSFNDSRTTESDHPGVDRQYSTGMSLRADYGGSAGRGAHGDRAPMRTPR